MRELGGRVAVVTGAASGIGRALATRFAAEGMKVALADVEEEALAEAARTLEADGARVLAVATDVTRADDVEALARKTVDGLGGVHVVCNNAGVFSGGVCWESPLSDYEWVLGVNTWGVIHGVRTFVPLLLEQGEGHVVNTASMAAVTALPYASAYHMSKHAVLAFSECLYHELALAGGRVGVSVLCPEMVATSIHRSERNRPRSLRDDAPPPAGKQLVHEALSQTIAGGVPPAEMADRVVRAIRENRFYVLSEDAWRRACDTRLDDIRAGRNPTLAPPAA